MCPHGWLPSPHLLSPPALSGYLAQANTCRAYPGLPTYATTRPGLDPAPNRACAHHGPTWAAVHLPQRTLLCSDKPSQDGSGCPKGMSTTLQHGMAGHHSSTPPFAPIVQCTPWYPQVYSRPYHRGAISTVRPGQGGDHSRARTHRRTGGPQQAPRPYGASTSPSRPHPDASSTTQVGRVHPNHPAALRLGMRMGFDSPGQLSSTTHQPSGRGRKFLK